MLLALQRVTWIDESNINQSIFYLCHCLPFNIEKRSQKFAVPSEMLSKLSYFLREFTASSELIHGFSSMFLRLLTIWDSFVYVIIQIRFNSFSSCSDTTQSRLNSSLTSKWFNSTLQQSLGFHFCVEIQLNSKLGNRIWINLRVWIDIYRSVYQ